MTDVFQELIQKIFDENSSFMLLKGKTNDKQNMFYGDYDYSISEGELNKCLQIIFDTLSEAGISFTIDKIKSEKTKIIVYEKGQTSNLILYHQLNIKKLSRKMYCKKIIPVVGPDGVGKTTLIDELVLCTDEKAQYYRFKKLFRKSFIYHISYRYLTKKLSKIHGKKVEKNDFDDYYGVFIIFTALIRYPLLMLSTFFGRKMILSDRYFYDYILKDISFKDKKIVLRDKWKFLLKMIPNSYWFLQLDAPTDIILARKQEMTRYDIEMYRKLMFKLYLNKPSVVYTYINTKNDLNECKNVLEQEARNNGLLR